MDKFQERYLAHQKRKALSLTSNYGIKVKKHKLWKPFYQVAQNRRSQRVFNNEPITDFEYESIMSVIERSPSSCGRKGIEIIPITDRNSKDLLSGLLVGGTGWCHRGQIILLLVAKDLCYKNPAEKANMPFLDAGVIIQSTYLACEALNLGSCYINPNVREENQDFFNERFLQDGETFCGAISIGHYDLKHV
jgi:nitroreductase